MTSTTSTTTTAAAAGPGTGGNPIPLPKKVAIFAIVIGNSDEPVFLKDLKAISNNQNKPSELNPDEYLYHFLLHSSLDMIADKQWTNANMFLGVVETFREYSVSAWVTISGAKLLLLHHGHTELQIKNFFKEAHFLWVKQAVNPLHSREEDVPPAAGSLFEIRIQQLASKHLV